MAVAKKKLEPPARGSMASILARMAADSGVRVSTAVDYSKNWRYLTFMDPKTGLPSIAHEWLLGAAGFRAGTINQFTALYATGKSSVCMLEYASAMRNGGAYCAHLETEGAGMSADRIAQFGLDPNQLAVPERCDSFEDAVAFIDTFRCIIRGGDGGSVSDLGRKSATKFRREDAEDPDCTKPILIGVDSLSALGKDDNTKLDITDVAKTQQISWLTVKIREWLRQKALVYQNQLVTLFLTTHQTEKIQMGLAMPGMKPEKTSIAGNAIGMFDTVKLEFTSRAWKAKSAQEQRKYGVEPDVEIGTVIGLTTEKNKLGPDHRRVDLYLSDTEGFDFTHTDAVYLLENKGSPFAKGVGIFKGESLCGRDSGGIYCKPLGDRKFKFEQDFVEAFYSNKEILDTCREGLRIRGYGLPHETKYKDSYDENGMFIGSGTPEEREAAKKRYAEAQHQEALEWAKKQNEAHLKAAEADKADLEMSIVPPFDNR